MTLWYQKRSSSCSKVFPPHKVRKHREGPVMQYLMFAVDSVEIIRVSAPEEATKIVLLPHANLQRSVNGYFIYVIMIW